MKTKQFLTLGSLATALATAIAYTGGAGAQPSQGAPGCEAQGEIEYICGPRNAEDIMQLGSSDWLILSGMSGTGPEGAIEGHLYLVDRETRALQEWFPGEAPTFAHDRTTFGACPGPIAIDDFSAHGLALDEQSANRYRLYITSHDAREAIEVFDVDASGAVPSITWVGCVVLPSNVFSNSVAIFDDGGFVTTQMMDRDDPEGFAGIMSGKTTGGVFEWHPGGELSVIPGTQLAGANGIALSEDERYIYVAAIGSAEVVRFDRQATPIAKQTVSLPIRPDNLRWGDDGLLYTTGGDTRPPASCATPPCRAGWSVVTIDPRDMSVERIAGAPAGVALQGASAALPVGDELWIGTFSGDRVAILPRP